tara:strand:- start:334 stop:669 length:336 start_codon:yes stop_codon:yes gene_type:complete
LIENSYYYYRGSYDGKLETIKSTVKKIINEENDILYYFVDDENVIMGNFFGIYSSYMYRYKDNNLMTTEASSPFGKVDKLKTTSTAYENMIIPNNPQVGRSYELHDNKNDS